MGKYADKYFISSPWQVLEEGFNPAYSEVAESIFSLGNEYTGLRGYFEEGYSGASLQGSYINGLYEERPTTPSSYQSMLKHSQFMVNSVNWVYTRIQAAGQKLNLASSRFSNFKRVVDMRTGVLTRSFVWHVNSETDVEVFFERFLSMKNAHVGGQRIALKVLKGAADISLTLGLDFSPLHMVTKENYWNCTGASGYSNCGTQGDINTLRIVGTTKTTGQKLLAACTFSGLGAGEATADNEKKIASITAKKTLQAGEEWQINRVVLLKAAIQSDEVAEFEMGAAQEEQALKTLGYDTLKAESANWWQTQWQQNDIEIEGDEENQQGIRFSIFQMCQTMHGAGYSAIIGAKGLTGEAYNGNAFWEAEVYCLPSYLFTNPKAAKAILQFRYNTLPQAKLRAKQLDCEGAYYPIATISGEECCDLWQHANTQQQPSTGVAYGLWMYQKLTGDNDFIYTNGIEMLVEICRMLATRGGWDSKTGEYGYFGVMGPDEFKMMVDHNTYTNFMAKKSFNYTLNVVKAMKADEPQQYASIAQKLALREDELDDWQLKADKMRILYSEETELFEQHLGYYNMPHIDIASIPVEDFPLYNHWSYDRIYRYDMSKQPDVLMFMLMHNTDFTQSQLKANFDYYEPLCSHESSLSPLVHSILAAQLRYEKQAYDLFCFTSRIDLDNYNRNTNEGLHTPSIAGSWMNMAYGFGGLRSDGDILSLSPIIPAQWQSYSFRLTYKGALICIKVTKTQVIISQQGKENLQINLYGKAVNLTASEQEFDLA